MDVISVKFCRTFNNYVTRLRCGYSTRTVTELYKIGDTIVNIGAFLNTSNKDYERIYCR